MRGNGCLLESD